MPNQQTSGSATADALEPLTSGSPEITRIIKKIIKLEQERLFQLQPHLNEDVLRIIKEEIK